MVRKNLLTFGKIAGITDKGVKGSYKPLRVPQIDTRATRSVKNDKYRLRYQV